MAKKERTLVLDIGSTAIHAGEFEIEPQSGSMTLLAIENVEFPEYPNENNRSLIISNALERVMESGKFSAKKAAICVSGQAAFMRFVKLPPVTEDDSSIRQIVEYEARQNVPFPMDEVIWDYQLIGSEEDDLEVMFAVIKNDIVEGVIDAVQGVSLKPRLVDFAPAALYNAARANYIGEEECAMLLDIGGRCTNLLFLDRGRFFARAIPIAGYSITQQIAKEFGISNEEAEVLKRRHGFVALGGAYEEPESEVAATISKIIRNVMTRLHGEINRSINVYRTQQKGNKPTRLYLAGGSSTMQFTDTFFSEKLRMEVTWFNPFRIVDTSPDISPDDLQKFFHVMPEVVGVALRQVRDCPVEISLVTDSIKQVESFNRRIPFLVMSAAAWLLLLFVFWAINGAKIKDYQNAINRKEQMVITLKQWDDKIQRAKKDRDESFQKYTALQTVMEQRYRWYNFYNELQECLPLDVWLSNVVPLDAPAVTGATSNSNRGSVFRPPAAGSRSVISTKGDRIEWFTLKGYCVFIPEVSEPKAAGTGSNDYVRPIFSPEQIALFKEIAVEKQTAISAIGDAGQKEEAQARHDSFMEIVNTNRVTLNTVLPEVFLATLYFHPRFSEDPLETRFMSFRPNDKVKNLTEFEIQIRATTPISVVR